MIRVLLFHAFLFLLPFIGYAAFLYFAKKADVSRSEAWEGAPVTVLATSGLMIAAVSFVLLAAFTGSPPDGAYTPSQFRDGVLVPGRIE
ncbi:MAG: DUF6111 family protein [Hyphomicrobiales bacterium]|nr:DUF6111 family protein [Hyphomicrobiales bacterium]